MNWNGRREGMAAIQSDLDEILAAFQALQRTAATGVQTRQQTLEDVQWLATDNGSVAQLGTCVCVQGYITKQFDGYTAEVPCPCRELSTACARYSAARVPTIDGVAGCGLVDRANDATRGLDWSRYSPESCRSIRGWLKGAVADHPARLTLTLLGSTGTGKTHVAAGMVRSLLFSPEWRASKSSALWMRWKEYLDACRNDGDAKRRIAKAGTEVPTARDMARSARLLVVDELSDAGREWGGEELSELLDVRGTAGRVTVLTANISTAAPADGARQATPAEMTAALARSIGDRASSRLVGRGVVVELLAPDFRLETAKAAPGCV